MGIKLDRALKLQGNGVTRVIDAFGSAECFKLPADALHARLAAIQSDMQGAKAPRWAIAHVRGYSAALMQNLYRESLVYGGYVDGQFMSTHRNRADYYEKNGIAPSEFAENGRVKNTGHYWIADTTRPFFIGTQI